MIFRNSILSILRSGGKTALFTLLIFSLTLVLALGVSVWASVAQFLEDCDEFYTTIGLFEYMGTGYPDETAYDPAMDQALETFDESLITADEATLLWDKPTRSLGYIDGFWRTDSFVPTRNLSVLVVGNIRYDEANLVYRSIVMKAIYSEMSEDDSILVIDNGFGEFESGHYYLVFGEVYRGTSPILHLREASYENAIAKAYGVEIPRIIDITAAEDEDGFYTIPEDSVLLDIADTLRVINNSVMVIGTDDLMAQLPFHQQELYFVDGRAFSPEEYAQGSRVAVISQLMADRLSVGVGDSIDLQVAVSDYPGIYNSYWAPDGFSYRESFTVVGIMNTVKDKIWYVYVPKSAGVPYSPHQVGYTIGQAILRNEDAGDFLARVDPQLRGRFQLTIYDQGYSSVAIPFQTILSVAKIVTAVCALVELAVLTLFGFLFVYRQRDTSETMRMLGASRRQVVRYFLYSAGFIALIATAAGAFAGYQLHGSIIELVGRAAENYALIDSRYSNGNLTISRTLEFAPHLDWQLFLAVGAVVFLLAVLACLAFTLGTFLYSRPSQAKPWGPRKPTKTSRLSGGSIKYAILSIRRGGARTLVVPVLAAAVVIFFGQLATTTLRYQEQLESIYDNTIIEGYYTDINGKQIGGQVLNGYDLARLNHSKRVENLSLSMARPYYYVGVSQRADGTEEPTSYLYVPENQFAREALVETIERGPDVTFTNNIRKAPEFYYADTIVMNYLDGYDESILAVPFSDERAYSCILPTSLMAEHGIALGDTVRLAFSSTTRNPDDDRLVFSYLDLKVVGSYEKQGVEDTVYAPLSLVAVSSLVWADLDQPYTIPGTTWSFTPEQMNDVLVNTTFNSASFTLPDSRALEDFKDYLQDYGYSQVNQVSRVREFIVLKDAAFNSAVASVKQQISYINLLYPCLYALAGIIALVVSYLLVVSRKKEIATMRGLGGTHFCSFFSFFYEQSILCVLGLAVGLGLWRLAMQAPTELHLTLTAGFAICYFAGCSVSIMVMNRASVLTILQDKD
ncbi:MAG TPA: FtsX-like permease family protein [Chloroflexi bacterium]|nr:FtsX-like permease family protein [Chloroflexota bacterium]